MVTRWALTHQFQTARRPYSPAWLVYIIDGVRVLRGHRLFMRNFHRHAFYILAVLALVGLAAWLVMWLYEALSLKRWLLSVSPPQ
jgi:hypothetical protein